MIIDFELVETNDSARNPVLMEERRKAIHDLTEASDFRLVKFPDCDCKIKLSVENNQMIFNFRSREDADMMTLALSPKPYRKLIQDYFLMVESYEAIRAEGNLYRLEAVDMARRAIHNEAAELLAERLADKISMDFDTARRLFTLICALHLGQGKQAGTL